MAAQLPDRILLDGEFMDLYSNPLEQYWTRQGKQRPSFYSLPSCKRGYIASWDIRNNQMYLSEIDGNFEKHTIFFGKKPARYTVKTLFPASHGRLVKAKWYSGKLRIPKGKMTGYVHSGYDSRFEKEIIITVAKGDVLKVVTLDYNQKSLIVNSDVIVRV